ncbi:SagB/ThcOx family dehydrogenase [Desulfosporosinus sp. PR]|uniref:SagB/ThcOx family dehydrogenase n=1 Tax=Candidatus Desulfosporosinus nitrosoreducens TaxID=3401928 RepID=UPI0027F84D6B|nr:SagB/ThcOx family dehydrogenase [Desulfosporosinus sp. PR]MDQ7094626.1 SagB/ThcOx family dehydrogenase [Desulfosporosinus sp. PR]
MNRYAENRRFLKSNFSEFATLKTDKMKGTPKPPEFKPYEPDSQIIDLPAVTENILTTQNIYTCIKERRSTRFYSSEHLSLAELSYLLWATQGVTGVKGGLTLRTVPCSGATHSFETYLLIRNIETIAQGLYRYLPQEHKLLLISKLEEIEHKINQITLDQPFVPRFASKAAVLFIWSTTPYRSEWKYDLTAHKKILIDVGHVCQNLYLASESIGAGTCAIGIYDQALIDQILGLDGEEEFVLYLAAVGKKQ